MLRTNKLKISCDHKLSTILFYIILFSDNFSKIRVSVLYGGNMSKIIVILRIGITILGA